MTAPPPRLELRGVSRRFGSVQALHGADFVLERGEVHALLGENGAGKSTLMHVAYGLTPPDEGRVLVDGVPREVGSPREARRLGLGLVHQHFTAIPAFTVAENVALAAGWSGRPALQRRRVARLAESLGLPLDPGARAEALPVALRQRLEIVKALAGDVRVLLLDEPTAVLAPAEVAELFRVIRGFAAEGGSVVLITHKLREALDVADRVTVLRRGRVTLAGEIRGRTADELAGAMIGPAEPAPDAGPAVPPPAGGGGRETAPESAGPEHPVILVRAEALDVARDRGYGIALRHATLRIAAGEILGIAAVEGNGQRELLRAVAGLIHPLRGKLEVAEPAAFVPEDRTREGLIPEFTLTENVVLGLLRYRPPPGTAAAAWRRGHRIQWRVAAERTAELIERFAILAPGPGVRALTLSGGNQQKLVIARALDRRPRVVIAENPTRGLDIAAAESVHQRLREAAAGGAAVLIHSSDLDELTALATRLIAIADGVVYPVPPGATRAELGELMLRARRPSGAVTGEHPVGGPS